MIQAWFRNKAWITHLCSHVMETISLSQQPPRHRCLRDLHEKMTDVTEVTVKHTGLTERLSICSVKMVRKIGAETSLRRSMCCTCVPQWECQAPATSHNCRSALQACSSTASETHRGSVRVSWWAHSYDMETMGGSNEEHMLLWFNRDAHCVREGILCCYSGSSQWKSEPPLLAELTLSQPPLFSLFLFSLAWL